MSENNGLQVIALAVGIISIPLAWLYIFLGVATGIIGIVLSVIAKRNTPNNLCVPALVCSIIGLVISACNVALTVIFVTFAFR